MQLRRFARIGLVTVTVVGCVGCDQVSKGVARSHLALGDSYSYLHDLLRLTHAENSGAFLGLGATLPQHTRAILFTWMVGVLCFTPLIAALLARGLSRWQVTGLALVAAGGFGNWIDRLTRDGHVTDFLNVGLGPLRTGIFNVADMTLMVGAAMFLLAAGGGRLLTRTGAQP
jgi:signal peptidase II